MKNTLWQKKISYIEITILSNNNVAFMESSRELRELVQSTPPPKIKVNQRPKTSPFYSIQHSH